jgi:ATP-dependent Clp protease protease subunit
MQNKRNGYYDFDMDFEAIMIEAGMVDEMFRLQDLKNRKLYLNEGITQGSVHEVVKHILQYNSDDKEVNPEDRKPILLYVVSNGGAVDAGFELIDVIQNSKTPVYTINLGYQYSMGFLIGLAGHKRYASKNAKFLMHDGSSFVYDSGAKVQDRMKFDLRVEERTKAYILSRGNLTSDEYDAKFRVEWYMFADEAKERGFVDYIIGVDCDIDEVI